MHRITSLLCAGLFAPVLAAQAGPGMLDADPSTTGNQAMVKSIYFSSVDNANTNMWDVTPKIWTISGQNMTQVHLGKGDIALTAGQYHMAITTKSLNTAWTTGAGGVAGSDDVIMGMVDFTGATPVFTPTTVAALMNTAGSDFGLMISADGTRAAMDTPTNAVWSIRSLAINIRQFQKAVAITGLSGAYVDPAPGKVNGVMGVFWVSGSTAISWAPVTETISTSGAITKAQLGSATAMVTATTQPHSPTPVFGTNGSVRGLWFSKVVSGRGSNEFYAGELPSSNGGIQVYDAASWSNNGGVAGSRFLCAYSGHYNTLLEGRGAHGGSNSAITVGASATLDVTIHSPTGTPSIFSSQMAIALGVGTVIPLPGICGGFGLDPSKLVIIIPGPTGITADEVGEVSLPASNTGLKGLTLHIQCVTIPTASFGPCFTNTFSPTFK